MPRQALVTGLGFITPIGNDRSTVVQSLREGRHGFENVEFLNNPDLSTKVVGTIKDFVAATPNWREWSYPEKYEIARETLRSLSPHGLYALCAIEQAIADAQLSSKQLTDGETGLYCASAGSTDGAASSCLAPDGHQRRALRPPRSRFIDCRHLKFQSRGTLRYSRGRWWLRRRLRVIQPRPRLRFG